MSVPLDPNTCIVFNRCRTYLAGNKMKQAET